MNPAKFYAATGLVALSVVCMTILGVKHIISPEVVSNSLYTTLGACIMYIRPPIDSVSKETSS